MSQLSQKMVNSNAKIVDTEQRRLVDGWDREQYTQHPQQVNIWEGIVRTNILGPYFFDDNVTGQRYL